MGIAAGLGYRPAPSLHPSYALVIGLIAVVIVIASLASKLSSAKAESTAPL